MRNRSLLLALLLALALPTTLADRENEPAAIGPSNRGPQCTGVVQTCATGTLTGTIVTCQRYYPRSPTWACQVALTLRVSLSGAPGSGSAYSSYVGTISATSATGGSAEVTQTVTFDDIPYGGRVFTSEGEVCATQSSTSCDDGWDPLITLPGPRRGGGCGGGGAGAAWSLSPDVLEGLEGSLLWDLLESSPTVSCQAGGGGTVSYHG